MGEVWPLTQRCDILQDHLEPKLVDHVDDGFAEKPLDLKLPAEPPLHRIGRDLEACGNFLKGKTELYGARQSPRPTLL